MSRVGLTNGIFRFLFCKTVSYKSEREKEIKFMNAKDGSNPSNIVYADHKLSQWPKAQEQHRLHLKSLKHFRKMCDNR